MKMVQVTDSVFVYNKDTMETETLPSMLQAQVGSCCRDCRRQLVCDWRLWTQRSIMNSIEVLDLNDPREWKMFPVRLREARSCCSAVAINEHEIYIIGGVCRHSDSEFGRDSQHFY